ncbi:MAG: serine hydrolase, partial [Acidimicrobiia bacterium]|nr:serine hydrolase [Acidimicrobiia bacterium]
GSPAVSASGDTGDHPALERSLEDVRQALGIPGMAAAVVQDQQLVWAHGFGYADLERKIEAGPDTPFGLASVTKPVAATLIMQLVEEGAIDLDAPVATYGVEIPDGAEVTVRHLLTHTSEGVAGAVHRYSGNRYGYLGGVIEGATGKTFAELLGERILVPVEMVDTALNPINAWGGVSVRGVEELRSALGWGESFEHYPDVYGRLAKPYQFDDGYGVIPGMYHLYHNPAAGLVSSVNDLAKFDIALDQGLLLGEQARAEMFAPAIPIFGGRSGLAYGLGWYVQEFEGMQLLWHQGRWPPSTSALYLKVPVLNLSYVVLANTDNLTVPFPGIGDGDVVGSTLVLTFFRHFVFAQQHGYGLPSIDWAAAEPQLVGRLAAVEDEASRAFLERELWSFRQAFASSGQHEQAAVLMSVSREAFPDSTLRFNPTYTSTAGRFPIIPPITSARTFVLVSKVVLVWLIVVLAALIWMVVRLVRSRAATVWDWTVWLLATVLLGPIAVLVHRVVPSRPDARSPATRLSVVSASLLSISGYGAAWVLAVLLLQNLGDDPNPLATLGSTLLIPLAVGLLLIRAPLLRRGGIRPFRKAISRGVVAELITLSIGVAALFSLTLYVDNRFLSTIPDATSPYFWAMMSFMTLVGLVALLPLNSLLARRGFSIWPAAATVQSTESAVLRLPTLRDSWWMLLVALGIMIAVIGLAASTFQ